MRRDTPPPPAPVRPDAPLARSSGSALATGGGWQAFAAAVGARAPRSLGGLGPVRAAVVAEVLAEADGEVVAARAAARAGLAAVATGAGPGEEPFAGAGALAALAERLVAEARRRTVARAAGGRARAAAAVDARLPTDTPERMDVPDFPADRRARLVTSLHRWNVRFGNYARFAQAVAPLLREGDTVLDLAAGHGGFAHALHALVPTPRFRVVVSDRDAAYLAAGRARFPRRDDVDHRVVDALRLARDVAPGEVDVVVCTSALHHFGAGGTALVLAQALARARDVVLVDLARSPSRLVVGTALARLGARDGALAHDTAVSFRRAFTPEELTLIARLVPGGEGLSAEWWPPGFVLLRTRRA